MKSRAGFTMVELLVYLAISTVFMLVITTFMVNISKSAARNRASLELQTNSRVIMAQLTQAIRTTTTTPTVSAHGVNVTNDGVSATYQLTGSAITKTVGASTTAVTGSNVSVSTFDVTQIGTVTSLTLTIQPATTGTLSAPPQTLRTTVTPRVTLYQ